MLTSTASLSKKCNQDTSISMLRLVLQNVFVQHDGVLCVYVYITIQLQLQLHSEQVQPSSLVPNHHSCPARSGTCGAGLCTQY
eukprot:COSAG01_NODE_2295_length_7967_cov_3.577021_6_plen_83_part_00